jgi:hypothetical protein
VAANFLISGGTNAPFIIVASGNGQLSPNSATVFGDKFDLPLSPPFAVCLDGLTNPIFTTGPTGAFGFGVLCPPVGTPPTGIALGFNAAYQAAVVDYFSAFGWSLTAATQVTVIQGPTVVYLATGVGTYAANGGATINLSTYAMTLPFYGLNHSTVHICGDGFMTFGGAMVPDFTPSVSEFVSGPPRIAGQWTDLDQLGTAVVKYTIDTVPPGGASPYLSCEFINVQDAVSGYLHTFSWKIDTQGFTQVIHAPTNNSGVYDSMAGIAPGSNLSPTTQKNFVGPTLPGLGSVLGPGILTTPPFSYVGNVNEGFFEWWGIQALHLYYANPYDNPYDMYATTLNFLPSGTGALPGATNKYTLY